MSISVDSMIGKTFGRWTIIGDYVRDSKSKHRKYLCKCSCKKGVERYVDFDNLRSGKTVSCGCLTAESASKRFRTHGESKNSRLYTLWNHMKSRCKNPHDKRYFDYGERGIKVCPEWESYENFRDWAYSNGFNDSLDWKKCSLDRIDNSKGYSPDNCRWVGLLIQSNNKRNNVVIEHNGVKKTATEWAREIGVKARTIRARYRKGQFDSLFNKNNKNVFIEYNGETHTLTEWSRIKGIKAQTLSSRRKKGYSVEEIFNTDNLRKRG